MKNFRYKSVICLVFLCLLTIRFETEARGVSKMKFESPVIENDAGGESNVTCMDNAEGILVSYQFLDEGYHSTTAFFESYYELAGERGGIVSVQNESAVPVRMNIALVDGDGRAFQIADGCYVQTNEAEPEYLKVENGCFELPIGFDGNISFPFGVFATDKGVLLEKDPDEIMGFGFVFVAEDIHKYELSISDFVMSDEEIVPLAHEKNILLLCGDDKILKPKVGDSESQYFTVLVDMCGNEEKVQAELSLETEATGISVKENGWICVGEEAQAEKIVLIAKTENGMIAKKEIELYTSWTNSIETENGWDASVAKPEEILPIVGREVFLLKDITLWLIRLGICGVVIIFFLYYKWIRQNEKGER